MPRARRRLSNLNIREIALCPRGIHPGARIVLYKARAPLTKIEGEPASFTDHFEISRLMEIDSALDRRLHALLATTTEIMRSDVRDKEQRVLRAVADYADAMERDVPDLFAGRLAKAIIERTADGRPSEDDVHAVVKSELGLAGLLPDEPSGGENMDFLKALTERGRAALKYVLGDRDPAEFFKGIPDEPAKLVVGLLEKAAEWAGRIDDLEERLAKAEKPKADPTSLESILKSIEDPGVRSFVETQAAALSRVSGEVVNLQKVARRKELADIAKSFECLPDANGELLAALEKADGAGVLKPIQAALEAANRQARIGKALQELGIDSIPGETGGLISAEEADQMLVAKAAEIRKTDATISAEKAYELACERNQDLFVATRQRRQDAAH